MFGRSMKPLYRRLPALVGAALALLVSTAPGQTPAPAAAPTATPEKTPPAEHPVKANYTKYEYRIPMRDGKRLFTAVYVPKDDRKTWPFLMVRTPYSVGPYGADNYRETLGPSPAFDKSGYIFVYQDVRGRYMSEGTFLEMTPHRATKSGPADVDESTDAYDTVEFLLRTVRGHNGRVGVYGISYPGFYTAASIIDTHPAIKAASPQAPMIDLYRGDDAYHNGAFMLAANFGFYSSFKPSPEPHRPPKVTVPFDYGTPDGYDFHLRSGPTINLLRHHLKNDQPLFEANLLHTTYDARWQSRNLAPHLRNITCAVLTVGGWFDAEDLAGPFRAYHAIEANNPGISNQLVIGPWVHGGWSRNDGDQLGDVPFNAKTSEFYKTRIEFPFFEKHLKDQPADLPEAYVFETGTNVWRKHDTWPPANATPLALYFHAGGRLEFAPPMAAAGTDQYASDPAHPVPFTGYITDSVPQRFLVDDQRFASRRPDVLTYQTEPLEEDLTIVGPVSPRLHVATTGTDADFVVKLIDVYPSDFPNASNQPAPAGKRIIGAPPVLMGGYQQLLRGEPFRAKFRHSLEQPEPMVPGRQEAISFTMPDVNHTFRRGHRIMIQVQSSWFPLVDRNPQTFTDIPNARPEDFRPATQTIYRQADAPSGVTVLVLPQ